MMGRRVVWQRAVDLWDTTRAINDDVERIKALRVA
jgi:hypothetical protein